MVTGENDFIVTCLKQPAHRILHATALLCWVLKSDLNSLLNVLPFAPGFQTVPKWHSFYHLLGFQWFLSPLCNYNGSLMERLIDKLPR